MLSVTRHPTISTMLFEVASWDCDLEQKAYDSIKTNEVDTRSIGHPANEYAEMPGPDGTMEKNVKDALNYWWDQNRNHERDNMNNANEKVGCTYKVDPPLFHFICAYVSLLTGPYNRSVMKLPNTTGADQ
ncbi:hypothetical protein ANCCEY_04270 [Ancylostoma ceylanicum]|uniref:SCP domain-containing protein n=1 Tax=Ancylostoma ceylanicum TaxID=53326 RepID=A0A0D6LX47_9BILA|nr:hypothetical protein ANCCEY_04270 [Ancylostoma ceylanicum]